MEQQITYLLSLLLATQLSLEGVLAAPGRDYIANSENSIIGSDSFKESVSLSSYRAMSITNAETAEPAIVVITVTVMQTTVVDSIVVPDILDSRTTTTGVSGTATDMAPLTINPLQYAGSTSSLLHILNADNVVTTSATIMAADSGSSSTSTFDYAICDDVFCNTEGNKICIYWGGITSWDVSLGPIPGEQPTIIGTC